MREPRGGTLEACGLLSIPQQELLKMSNENKNRQDQNEKKAKSKDQSLKTKQGVIRTRTRRAVAPAIPAQVDRLMGLVLSE